jgi:hypothetical protein
MDIEDIYARIGDIHAEACGAEIEHEFIEVMVEHLVEAALSVGVEGWATAGDPEIENSIGKKVHNLLLMEVARINGT